MNYLGIDLGDKRCGISYSSMGIVFPGETIPRVEIFTYLKKQCKERDIGVIVVGLPYDLYGIEKKQLEKTQVFIDKLKKTFSGITIESVDERFTTFESIDTLEALGKKDIFKHKDTLAAVFILERYLSKIKTK